MNTNQFTFLTKWKNGENTYQVPIILFADGIANNNVDHEGEKIMIHLYELEKHIKSIMAVKSSRIANVSLTLNDVIVESVQDRFIKKITEVIEKHMANSSFCVETLADEMTMSSVQLYRRLKTYTGHTPNQLIRNFRLERAASLLHQRSGNVSEIAYAVGFNTLSYFTKCFREAYGYCPSQCTPEHQSKKELNVTSFT